MFAVPDRMPLFPSERLQIIFSELKYSCHHFLAFNVGLQFETDSLRTSDSLPSGFVMPQPAMEHSTRAGIFLLFLGSSITSTNLFRTALVFNCNILLSQYPLKVLYIKKDTPNLSTDSTFINMMFIGPVILIIIRMSNVLVYLDNLLAVLSLTNIVSSQNNF